MKNTIFRPLLLNCAAAKFLIWDKSYMYFILGLMTSDNLKSKIECLEKQKSRLSVMTSQELSEITGLTLHKHPAYT